MTPLEDFYTEVRLDAPDVGVPIVELYLRNAAREFCKRTHIWQETVTRSLAAANVEYLVPLPENTILQDITYMARKVENTNPAKYSDKTEAKITQADMDWENPGWRDLTQANAHFRHWGILPGRNKFFVSPTPAIDYVDGIRYTMILAPDQVASDVIDILYDEYLQVIAAGASAKILRIPNKNWTDIVAAEMRQKEFNRGIGAAIRKTQSVDPRVKFRRLGS